MYKNETPQIVQGKLNNGHDIKFYGFGKKTIYRYKTLYLKEPDTIRWLDEIPDGSHLWDIGANIGLYTIYAAIARGKSVTAFEPGAANYFVLNRNIELNNLSELVQAQCIAFSDKTEIGSFNMGTTIPGGAQSTFNDDKGDTGEIIEINFRQGMVGFSIDDYIDLFKPKFPTHIKMDVDGLEHKIVAGMSKTLLDNRLIALSVELDSSRHEYVRGICEQIERVGFKLIGAYRSPHIAAKSPIKNYHFHR
jgi:FkbM family methyltransferase